MQKVRVGIIGVGGIAQGVHLPQLLESPDAIVTAVCDIDTDTLNKVGDRCHIPQDHRFTDYHDLVRCPDVDAVEVCTPNNMHIPCAVAAVQAGKAINVEKPLALSREQALPLMELLDRNPVPNMMCFSYRFRPAVRYAGHGFQYMNGYSSTDFRDYMVYSNPSKLVTVSGLPDSFIIENENDMPRLDGAEACYPLYAAFAKAIYKDIDRIELNDQGKHRADNGKIVTFTNSLVGFERLIFGAPGSDRAEEGIDMFFGARPSKSQLWFAEEMKVDLEITPIAREGFIFFVEADNPVTDLTSDQLKAIYHGDITNWKELGGKDQPIRAFQRPEGSGSQTMMQYFMGDLSLKKPESYEVVGAMEGVVTRVAEYHNEAGALGYSFRYFLEGLMQEKGVRMLSIDGVYPSIENIENGTYPLITNVVVITRKNEDHPGIAKMLNLILSDYGQDIIRRTGYAPLSRE